MRPGKLLQLKTHAPTPLYPVRYPTDPCRRNRPMLGFSVLIKSTKAAQMFAGAELHASASQPLCSWSIGPDWNHYNEAQVSHIMIYYMDVFARFVSGPSAFSVIPPASCSGCTCQYLPVSDPTNILFTASFWVWMWVIWLSCLYTIKTNESCSHLHHTPSPWPVYW